MANGDTKTNQYLDIAANGSRADLPADSCCDTRTQSLIRGVAERIMDVEDEVEQLENNPDVVDIVATYADLQAYDTSGLTDKDIIRVLEDSTHDNNSTYYRWNATTNQFDFVGEISGGTSSDFTVLTDADANWTNPNTGDEYIALWLLPTGKYTLAEDSTIEMVTRLVDGDPVDGGNASINPVAFITSGGEGVSTDILFLSTINSIHATVSYDTGISDEFYSISYPFAGTDGITDGYGGLVPAPLATDADKFLKSDGTWEEVSGGGVTELTSADYNANSSNWSDTDPANFNCVALWKMPRGMYYKADSSVNVYISTTRVLSTSGTAIIGAPSGNGTPIITLSESNTTSNGWKIADVFIVGSLGWELATWGLYQPKDNLTSANANEAPLSAKQGKVLKDLIDALDARVSALEGN